MKILVRSFVLFLSICSLYSLSIQLSAADLSSLKGDKHKQTAEAQKLKKAKVKKTWRSGKVIAVNVNTASAEQLADSLKGIGLTKAKAIIAYRKARGNFKSASDLMAVKGVGASIVARNKANIRYK